MKGVVIAIVVLAMVQLMVEPSQAISCTQVATCLTPCMPYLTGGALQPACCKGVSDLKTMAVTTADKRLACNCVKAAASRLPNIKDDAAQSLGTKCHVDIGIPVSRNTNCDAIN